MCVNPGVTMKATESTAKGLEFKRSFVMFVELNLQTKNAKC